MRSMLTLDMPQQPVAPGVRMDIMVVVSPGTGSPGLTSAEFMAVFDPKVVSLTGIKAAQGSLKVNQDQFATGLVKFSLAPLNRATNPLPLAALRFKVIGSAGDSFYFRIAATLLEFAGGTQESGALAQARVIVTPAPLQYRTPNMLPATMNNELCSFRLEGTGGVRPLRVTPVTLMPPNLELKPDGQVYGYPRDLGLLSFEAVLSDGNTPSTEYGDGFGFQVTEGPFSVPPIALEDFIVGQTYNVPLQVRGGVPPYSWALTDHTLEKPPSEKPEKKPRPESDRFPDKHRPVVQKSSKLPPGIVLTPEGFLSGKCAAPGVFWAWFKVQDSAGHSANVSATFHATHLGARVELMPHAGTRAVLALPNVVPQDYELEVDVALSGYGSTDLYFDSVIARSGPLPAGKTVFPLARIFGGPRVLRLIFRGRPGVNSQLIVRGMKLKPAPTHVRKLAPPLQFDYRVLDPVTHALLADGRTLHDGEAIEEIILMPGSADDLVMAGSDGIVVAALKPSGEPFFYDWISSVPSDRLVAAYPAAAQKHFVAARAIGGGLVTLWQQPDASWLDAKHAIAPAICDLVAADLDGDGLPELGVGTSSGLVFYGTDGRASGGMTTGGAAGDEKVSVAVVPGDGVPAIIAANRFTGSLVRPNCLPAEPSSAALLPGLAAEFFAWAEPLSAIPDLKDRRPDVVRVDSQVNYTASISAWPGLDDRFKDSFVCRLTGFLKTDIAGAYWFYLSSDDGSRLWIDGKLVIDNDGAHSMKEEWCPLHLSAGLHALRIEYFEDKGAAGLILSYQLVDDHEPYPQVILARQVVPTSALFHSGFPGLVVELFDPPQDPATFPGPEAVPVLVTETGTVNFGHSGSAWPQKSPFTARLSGYMEVLSAGDYTFTLESAGHARLWISGELVVDDRKHHAPQEQAGHMKLPGGWHPIVIDYRVEADGDPLFLRYAVGSATVQEMPSQVLFHGGAPGLVGEYYRWPSPPVQLPDLANRLPDLVRIESQLNQPSAPGWPGLDASFTPFVARFRGWLNVSFAGEYTFYLDSDDGSRLLLDGKPVVENDREHSMRTVSGKSTLSAGWHRIEVDYFNSLGGVGLILSYEDPKTANQPIPASALFHTPGAMVGDPGVSTNGTGSEPIALYLSDFSTAQEVVALDRASGSVQVHSVAAPGAPSPVRTLPVGAGPAALCQSRLGKNDPQAFMTADAGSGTLTLLAPSGGGYLTDRRRGIRSACALTAARSDTGEIQFIESGAGPYLISHKTRQLYPACQVSPGRLDAITNSLGDAWIDSNAVLVGNAGGAPLEIASASLRGDPTGSLALFEPQSFPCRVDPGRAVAFGIVFFGWPAMGARTLAATLVISSTDPLYPVVRIPLRFRAGLAESPIQPAGTSVEFPQAHGSPSVSSKMIISNNSTVPMHIVSARFHGSFASRFTCGGIGLSIPARSNYQIPLQADTHASGTATAVFEVVFEDTQLQTFRAATRVLVLG